MKQTFAINTSKDKDSDEVTTQVTVDFDGYTLDHAIKGFFVSTSPRVLLQQRLRNLKGAIPTKYECKALELLGKASPVQVRPMTPAEMIEAVKGGQIKPEERAALLAMLQAK